jgi:hypothetical protein
MKLTSLALGSVVLFGAVSTSRAADLAAGKIAVNIDGQRMNAKIAANAVRNPIS